MSEISERFRNVVAQFTQRAKAVPAGAWDNATPCEGWVARDIVRHMVAWMPGYFLASRGVETPAVPSVDQDPLGAWEVLSGAIQSALDKPEIALRAPDTSTTPTTLEQAVGMFGIGDVLVHTWDLARATGLDERLDAEEVHRLLEALNRTDGRILENGHFATGVRVSDDADEQTKLIALTGRRP